MLFVNILLVALPHRGVKRHSNSRDGMAATATTDHRCWNLAVHILKLPEMPNDKTITWFGPGDICQDTGVVQRNLKVIDGVALVCEVDKPR